MGFWNDHVLPRLVEHVCGSEEIAKERARWVPRAEGRVIEIGIGSGLNLDFYDRARVSSVVGVDPSAPLLARTRERVAQAPVAIELVRAVAEDLPFDDATFDSAVITYTLCSVVDPVACLRQLRRVLRPSAALFFVEHGLAPDRTTAILQRMMTPLWRRGAGNCHLDRDVRRTLEGASFSIEEIEMGASDGPRWSGFTFQGVARRA